ncbi:type II toxin-antitoxin system RelE/ParE family toxin [Geomonas sp.]|uniref:type II toxin-antitoxin system RelE/ParE family toxin n=1 Tax=Geomonas sp. TaxID=2651584 RepID=UPI002B45FED6|nr:type II toxin-antitoxin system RelE/ParE family toxin [Geomonas sp.]HJV35918.1 type II toxin-antitoxin system RelE/ParE family toxin [Geomonas sp.]
MRYSLEYFHPRIQKEIESWPVGILADFARIAELLKEFGPDLGMPYSRALGDGLFELRARGSEGIGPGFYCFLIGRRIVILHAFVKKTQATPVRQLEIARKRLKEVRKWLT